VTTGTYQIQGFGLSLAQDSTSVIEKDFAVDNLIGGGSISIQGNTSFTVGRSTTPARSTTFNGTISGASAELVKDDPGVFTFTGDARDLEATNVRQGTFRLIGGLLSETIVTGSGTVFTMLNGRTGRLNVRNSGSLGDDNSRVGHTGDIQLEDMNYVQSFAGPNEYQRIVATGTASPSGRRLCPHAGYDVSHSGQRRKRSGGWDVRWFAGGGCHRHRQRDVRGQLRRGRQ
jgi:hypothetical protein